MVRKASAARSTRRLRTTTCWSRASRATPAGLGYFGFSYYEQNADALNLVSVDDGDGCVAPSAESIQDGSYTPLSRPLFMYPSATALTDKPEVEGFMQYVVDSAPEIAEAALIVPMSDDQASEAQSAFEGAIGG